MKPKLVIFDFYRTLFNPETEKENEGASELLHELAKLKMNICIASRQEKGSNKRENDIGRQGFIQFVNRIYLTEKDDKTEIFKQAIQDFNCSANTTIIVGDYIEIDVKPALNLGCVSIWFKNGKFASETPEITGIDPTYIIESLSDLLKIIDDLGKYIIAIDFDGTCVTHDYPKVGKNIGAEEVLKELVEAGHKLILFTMRSNIVNRKSKDDKLYHESVSYLSDALKWFELNGISLHGIQSNPEQFTWTTSPKAYANLYIDDAALGCPLIENVHDKPFVDWVKVRELLIDKAIIK